MVEQARIIRWEEPLPVHPHGGRPPGTQSSRWDSVAEQLRARPGRSAVVAEGAIRTCRDLTWRINRGLLLCFSPAGAFKATTRQAGGTAAVYARYLGDGEASDA